MDAATTPADSLIEFPCDFPIKVMGLHTPDFDLAIAEVARRFDPDFNHHITERRPSRSGRYLGLTITVRVHNRPQLDDLYRALTGHPMVKVVL